MRNIIERPSVLIILILLVLILFGWRRLPDIARSVGQAFKVLRSELSSGNKDAPVKDAPVKDAEAAVRPEPLPGPPLGQGAEPQAESAADPSSDSAGPGRPARGGTSREGMDTPTDD